VENDIAILFDMFEFILPFAAGDLFITYLLMAIWGEILLAPALPLSVGIVFVKGTKATITNIAAINTPIITFLLFIMI
jgi:hypothetical protein